MHDDGYLMFGARKTPLAGDLSSGTGFNDSLLGYYLWCVFVVLILSSCLMSNFLC